VLKGLVDNLNPEKLALDQSTRSLSKLVPSLRFNIPKNATRTVYVEGLPADTTEREVAHLFRPYPGYR
jgi:RNA recognition motif-containing protein